MRRYVLGLVAVLMVVTAVPAAAAGRTEPEQRCYGVQGHGETAYNPSTYRFEGSAAMRVGGELQDVLVTVISDGTYSRHRFEFDQGTVSTKELVIVRPTDDPAVMQLLSRPTVVTGGTGKLHLLPGSTLRFFGLYPVAASWDIRGEVCFDERSDT